MPVTKRRAKTKGVSVEMMGVTPPGKGSLLANFKRRPRQPSIIRLVQQASQLGDDLELEGELTLLKKSIAQEPFNPQRYLSTSPQIWSSRKRNRNPNKIRNPNFSPLPSSSPPLSPHRSPSLPSRQPPQPQLQHHHDHRSKVPSLPENTLPPSYSPALSTNSDTMADPHSSSPLPISPLAVRKYPRRTVRKDGSHALTTAALQTLLPRPPRVLGAKRPLKNELDLSSDSWHESGDKGGVERRSLVNRRGGGNVRRNVRRKRDQVYRQRRGGEEKENYGGVVGLSGTDSEGYEAGRSNRTKDIAASKELDVAKKKFAEVDEWEMEFESVDMGSTPNSWR